MLTLHTDFLSAVPVYRQIVDGLRILLVNGDLKPGDRLPPVRRLALDLGIHFNTVAEAYRTLADEGWLDLARRTGAQVVAREPPRENAREGLAHLQGRLPQLIAEAQARGIAPRHIARELRRLAEKLENA